jgi:hypothetical protein
LFIVEVKGGGVRFDGQLRAWYSIDRRGTEHRIKDPFIQARKIKYDILAKLAEDRNWLKALGRRAIIGYGVVLPDIADKNPILGPDRPAAILATIQDLHDLQGWIKYALEWWANNDPESKVLGKTGAQIVEKTFARSFTARSLAANRI